MSVIRSFIFFNIKYEYNITLTIFLSWDFKESRYLQLPLFLLISCMLLLTL